jgi:short-subunit dehydrogenase
VARSKDRLDRLAEALRGEAKVQITVLPADLSSSAAVDDLIGKVKSLDPGIDILVNNAGLGVFENFLDALFAKQIEQVDVPGMVARHRGGVINLASTAGFQPLAGAAVYAASKAFVLLFSEALALELDKTGVRITAACPGPVATEFFADMHPSLEAKQMDQPGPVVREILEGFERGQRVVYPGKLSNRLGTWGARFMPRNMILRAAEGTTTKLNQK